MLSRAIGSSRQGGTQARTHTRAQNNGQRASHLRWVLLQEEPPRQAPLVPQLLSTREPWAWEA